jgi:glycosyltransferase involved in cell wall biosynthesis
MNDSRTTDASRPRIALVTNHGYAGIDIPVGGAPDTGGQNIYVNSLADALDQVGFDVTIFARGGFPFFESDKIREGVEWLSDHVRYVYIPGGGNEFIRKEDIAIALDEEVAWLGRFITREADEVGVMPWEYYEILNTHYWDAAIIGVKIVEHWKDHAALNFLRRVSGGGFAPYLGRFRGDHLHKLGLSREIHWHLGELAKAATNKKDPKEIVRLLTTKELGLEFTFELESIGKRQFGESICIGKALALLLRVEGADLMSTLMDVDTHVWTPHSLGVIKERNFWGKDLETIRSLKLRERESHEEVACRRTPLFCSTSSEIWRALVSYHNLDPKRVFDFPPCIDGASFRPRTEEELTGVYRFLSEKSGISKERLKNSLMVFETSRMDRTKRKDLLLGAFAEVAKKRDDVYLFIGGGPEESRIYRRLKDQIDNSRDLRGRAFLLGYVSEDLIEPLFSAADLFVSASEMEGFGMSVSQAAAAGVAIVSSDLIPFATQYSKDAAVVVPAGYQHGFAQAMDRLLSDGDERSRRAKQLLKVAGEFDWVSTARRFVDWFYKKRGKAARLPDVKAAMP